MATSDNADSILSKTDRAVHHHADGFDQFYNDIGRFELDTSLVDYLISRCVLTIDDANRIREVTGQVNRNKLLFNILKDRPYDSFRHFTEASEKTNTIPDGDLVNTMKAFKTTGLQPDVRFADKSIKMEDFQVRLQKSYLTVVEQMSSPMDIADRLLELETYNTEDYHDINSLPTPYKRIRKILSKVASKRKSGYDSFLKVMKDLDDSEDKRLAGVIENMEVTSADRLLLQIGLSYENVELPSNVRESVKIELEEWKQCDEIFIPTRAAKEVYTKIKCNNCVTVTGNSGMGKTMTVRHVALEMLAEGYVIVIVAHPDEIVMLYSALKNAIFVVDDLCGKYTMNQSYFEKIKSILEKLKILLRNQNCKIISTCRLQVFKDVKFKTLSVFNECECNLNADNFSLTHEEIESFATKYFGEHEKEALSLSNEYDCFPFLCNLYHKQQSVNFDTFCKNPFQFIGEEVDTLLLEGDEGKYKYCVLVLCVIHNNHLTEKYLTGKIDKDTREIIEHVLEECELNRGTSPKCLHKALETLVGTFLTKDKNCYRMLHDKLFDYISFHLGENMIDIMIEHADIAFLRERFLWDESNAVDKVDFTISLPDDAVNSYIEQIITDWRKKNATDFFSNRNLKSTVFTDKVLDHLNNLSKSDQKELVNIVDKDESQYTPLICCCYQGNLKLTKWLLQNSADVNQCSSDSFTALYMACHEGYIDIVRELLQHGADVNQCSSDGLTALHIACHEGYMDIVRELLQHGADVNKCSNHGSSPLHNACHTDIVVDLLKHDVMVELYDKDGDTALYSACEDGNTEIVKLLLERGVNVNKCSNTGESPLLVSCVLGNVDIVGMLLHKDADVNLCIHNKQTYIEEIRGYRNRHSGNDRTFWTKIKNTGYKMTKAYIDGDDWIINKTAGASPLHLACFMGHDEIVNRLLEKSPDINLKTDDGTTPLFLACEIGHEYLVTLLLSGGADAGIYRQDGKTPYSIAIKNGHNLMASMLLRWTDGVEIFYQRNMHQ